MHESDLRGLAIVTQSHTDPSHGPNEPSEVSHEQTRTNGSEPGSGAGPFDSNISAFEALDQNYVYVGRST